MITPASIKEKLKNIATKHNKTLQELLISYALERTIYRIANSKYLNNFTLKGGIFLYAFENGNFSRSTTDIDFLAQNISNQISDMKTVFSTVFSAKTNDPLRYDLNTMVIKSITEQKKYPGINVFIYAFLDKTRIPVSIDIGFNDVIHPEKTLIDFPILLPSSEIPSIYAYTIYSCISEKFEAIVSLGYANSRFKDFYDIYIYLSKFEFDGKTLQEALTETFAHRGTTFNDIVVFETDFSSDQIRQTRWNNFAKKKNIAIQLSLTSATNAIKHFLEPVIQAINSKSIFSLRWSPSTQSWH